MRYVLKYHVLLLISLVYYTFSPTCYGQKQSATTFDFPRYYHSTLDEASGKQLLIGLASMQQLSNWKIPASYKHYIDSSMLHPKLLKTLKSRKNNTKKIIVFGGFWWCGDTREIVKKLMLSFQLSAWDESRTSFIGMDRQKRTACNLENIFNVSRVPTIIVTDEEGKEVGRVVEYGKTGNWEEDLISLLQK